MTRRVLDDGCPVGYLYREEPDDGEDSGWRITANDESEDYMDDAENLACVSLGVVLNLDEPEGAADVRNPETGQFEPCEDEGSESRAMRSQ